MQQYDAIVIGTGGVGSAAVMHLARRGARVLGLDRFGPGHDRGSSHGQTRIIRQAYCEHPDYVPLVRRAYELWSELEAACGERLFRQTGLLEVGPPDGYVLPGIFAAARQHDLKVEPLTAEQVSQRFPGFVLPHGAEAVFEAEAGYLRVERCVTAHLAAAEQAGAVLKHGVEVRDWTMRGGTAVVETDQGQFGAEHLIITAGAWASQLLVGLGIDLPVLRKPLHWFACGDARYRADNGCPGFLFELPEAIYYGFPEIGDGQGVKVAAHTGGVPVNDPLKISQEVDLAEREPVERFLAAHLPGVSNQPTGHAVCMYTMSPDGHFLVDRHPEFPQVLFTAGLSGHGFKFANVLGKTMADLALDGETDLPIGFLSARRPGLL